MVDTNNNNDGGGGMSSPSAATAGVASAVAPPPSAMVSRNTSAYMDIMDMNDGNNSSPNKKEEGTRIGGGAIIGEGGVRDVMGIRGMTAATTTTIATATREGRVNSLAEASPGKGGGPITTTTTTQENVARINNTNLPPSSTMLPTEGGGGAVVATGAAVAAAASSSITNAAATTTTTTATTSPTSNSPETISYSAERIIGNGSFGVVFQASVVETGEIVAIKKVLQDKRFKNRELQIMRQLVKDGHSNIVALKHCFYSQVSSVDEKIKCSWKLLQGKMWGRGGFVLRVWHVWF